MIKNKVFRVSVSGDGCLSGLFMNDDPYQMNWVIDNEYLQWAHYQDADKLFGHFDFTAGGETIYSNSIKPGVEELSDKIVVTWNFKKYTVQMEYQLGENSGELLWTIRLENLTDQDVKITEFGIWAALSYIMFRDKDVLRNIHNSAAVFPSISTDYTKLNAVRRDNKGGNLGLYQVRGKTLSIGTYCDYENLFFENVSPSLDGILFHKLFLAGGYPQGIKNHDWIYEKGGFVLNGNSEKVWEYAFCANTGEEDFKKQGLAYNHPRIEYTPVNIIGNPIRMSAQVPKGVGIVSAKVFFKDHDLVKSIPVPFCGDKEGKYNMVFEAEALGEHKAVITLSDGSEDFVVLNVMDPIEKVIEERVEYICSELYNGADGKVPYAFEPVSNQGESLGKLNLVLKKNLLGTLDISQVRKVEESAVCYVRPKWFVDGDFTQPRKLYGDFYRCMDFEYIGHLFYLLSEFDDGVLALHSADTYLEWSADVFDLRVNPDLHKEERGKEEAQMLGVYFLYIEELLEKLKKNGLTEKYQTIRSLWNQVMDRVDAQAESYKAAITEHFYDNAGFGPTAGALSECQKQEGAKRYGELLLANIGYSNDFRAQNPDRWWEALSYMIHSLWGGVTAAAAYKVYRFLKDPEYLKASYRATAGILYCYDTHATAAAPLKKGMAASTYAVAGPHLNRPDLSRERFGQSVFYRDGGIFARLFENDSQTQDWDMGEELVAYLDSFGQKTFILQEEGAFSVINGSFEETEDTYLITSFAPYSREFYLVSGHDIIPLENKKGLRTITLQKERG